MFSMLSLSRCGKQLACLSAWVVTTAATPIDERTEQSKEKVSAGCAVRLTGGPAEEGEWMQEIEIVINRGWK